MAPASNEEQFKFLISCIRYSNNGKVDFSQVAQECKIVSKGAAAKRYERMMRAHGIAPNTTTVKPAPNRVTKTERRESRAPKKRKGDAFMEDNVAADDEETFTNSIKPDPVNTKEELVVKEEHSTQDMARLALDTNAGFMQYMDDYSTSSYGNFETEPEYSFSSASYNNPQGTYGYDVQANDSYSYAPTTMPMNASSIMRTSSMGGASSGIGASSGGDARGMYKHQTQQADNHYSQNSIVLD